MNRHTLFIALGMLLVGCQTTTSMSAVTALHAETLQASFKQQAFDLTEKEGELVLSEFHFGQERNVALIVRYTERTNAGAHCRLSIVEMTEEGPVIAESSDQVMSCSGMSVPTAEAVSRGLEATLEPNFIRLHEDRIRNRSEYEFRRAGDGRWHLAYSADIGPESDPVTGDLVVTSYAVAYGDPLKGPVVSEVNKKAIQEARERSIY